jgi:predicted lipoprotein with Yx(FWY)xxD motif
MLQFRRALPAALLVLSVAAYGSLAMAQAPAKMTDGVLANTAGMTLYTFDKDEGSKSMCNGPCAANWPPLMAGAGDTASGDYSIITRDDGGKQWALKGKPLYYWVKDAKAGDMLTAKVFDGVKFVDVLGHTKGRGFQGVVKRFKFAGGRASHGGGWNRKPGSIGNREWPARVFKNKRLTGHMGSVDITTQNLRVVKVLADDHALFLEGAVPGPMGGIVLVRKAIKKA